MKVYTITDRHLREFAQVHRGGSAASASGVNQKFDARDAGCGRGYN
jgi:hypothetical protein